MPGLRFSCFFLCFFGLERASRASRVSICERFFFFIFFIFEKKMIGPKNRENVQAWRGFDGVLTGFWTLFEIFEKWEKMWKNAKKWKFLSKPDKFVQAHDFFCPSRTNLAKTHVSDGQLCQDPCFFVVDGQILSKPMSSVGEFIQTPCWDSVSTDRGAQGPVKVVEN